MAQEVVIPDFRDLDGQLVSPIWVEASHPSESSLGTGRVGLLLGYKRGKSGGILKAGAVPSACGQDAYAQNTHAAFT